MEQPTILICGNYGAGNFGDELILKGIVKTVRELHPKAIIVTSGNPEKTATNHGIRAIHFFPSTILSLFKSILTFGFFRSIYYLYTSDIVLFGGGCLFNEKEPASINIWYRQFQWFRIFRKKVIILGQSFGKFSDRNSIRKIKEVIRYAKKIFVRDEFSKKMLSSFTASNIEVLLDPALWLQGRDLLHSVQDLVRTNKTYILLIIREWATVDKDSIEEQIAILAKHCLEKYQLPSRILILQDGASGDERISNELYRKIKPYCDALPQKWTTIDDMVHIYDKASLIVSMRLHGGILGLILGKPTLFLDYDDKVGNLLADLGLENLLIDPKADRYELKADELLDSASRGPKNVLYEAIQKNQSQGRCKYYLTKIINPLK